jgi:peptide/nickel transport system substrate-binding protein
MRFRLLRLKFHRRLRKGQRHALEAVEGLGQQAEERIERHVFKRFDRLWNVQRFVFGWTGLVILLIIGVLMQNVTLNGYFQTLKPVPGGIYTEGIVGAFTGANPLYAQNEVDLSVSRLVFAGLFKHDTHNNFVGDLASDYSVDAKGNTYTVHLKPQLTWQDGQPLTSDDVLFTYQSIQNPDAQSPLRTSWQGVTVTAPDKQTVVFKLPNVLASFPYNLTNGIVPRHILGSVAMTDLRTADFNTIQPVGSGPFKWQTIQVSGTDPTNAEEQVVLVPFAGYNGGQPKLSRFIVHAFADQKLMEHAFKSGSIRAMQGLSELPASISAHNVVQHNLLYTAGTYVFFKTTEGVLNNQVVRQALVRATNQQVILKRLGYATHEVKGPLLSGQQGYDKAYNQAGFDVAAANDLLNKDGWVSGKDGIRHKDKVTLSFSLTAGDSAEYAKVSGLLAQQWAAIGVKLDVRLQGQDELQYNLSHHAYDAVLYGISIGQDPDVFVYWDSSQANALSDNRLNLSEYKNTAADAALESGRTRLDPAIRTVKYRPFFQAWQQDAPAVGLYQPRLLYITKGMVFGLKDQLINTATDRYNNVQNWEVREARVTN